jgi:hypothetical protein
MSNSAVSFVFSSYVDKESKNPIYQSKTPSNNRDTWRLALYYFSLKAWKITKFATRVMNITVKGRVSNDVKITVLYSPRQ